MDTRSSDPEVLRGALAALLQDGEAPTPVREQHLDVVAPVRHVRAFS